MHMLKVRRLSSICLSADEPEQVIHQTSDSAYTCDEFEDDDPANSNTAKGHSRSTITIRLTQGMLLLHSHRECGAADSFLPALVTH